MDDPLITRLLAAYAAREAERAEAAMDDPETATLRAALAAAKAEREMIGPTSGSEDVHVRWERYEAAESKVLAAERAFAAAQRRPYAVPADCPLERDMGAPLPTLLQCDNDATLFFLLAHDRDHVGVVKFERCLSTRFGDPGEESIGRHPLSGSGLDERVAMQVINSPWVEELRKIDSAHQYHDPELYRQAKHFIFAFHDTMFECVARSLSASRVRGSLGAVVKKAVDRLC